MAKLIATGNTIQLPQGTVQISKIQLRSLIDPEYRRIFLNDTGPTHRYVEIPRSSWTFNETTSVLTIIGNYNELEIDYVEPLDTAAISRIVPITKANTSAKRNRRVDTTANNILEAQQANKISNEGTVIGNFTETNGFKSLTAFAKEGELITKRVMPVKLTETAADGSLKLSTNNSTELTNIFGSVNVATGSLKKIITSGAPQSLLKQMQKNFSSLPPAKIRTYASNVSINPSTTIESLKPENSPSLISVQTASKIYKDKLKLTLNNSAFNLNPLGAFPGLGRSKQNSAAQFIGTLLNKVGSVFGSILNGLKVFGDNPSPSITSAFGGNVKDLIEVGGAQTNISSYMSKGNLVDIQAPKITYVLQNQNDYMGYATSDEYEFTFVTSTEELITEFQKSRRGPDSVEDDAIGGLFVHESTNFTGPPEKANVKTIHEGVKKAHLKILTREIENSNTMSEGKTAAETALERISIYPNRYAMSSHYVILTDGSLQRARPIDKPRSQVSYPRFNKTAVQITFLSGGKKPNTKMFETYDRFLKAWFTVFPDCGVYGNNESRPSDPPNTFDVRQSIKSKYRFVYRYDDLSDLDEFPTKVERVITKPKTIAKTSSTITKPISFAEANQQVTDLVESKRFNNDVTSIFNKAGAAMASLNGEDMNAAAAKFGAENLPKNDLKAQFDKDYKTFQSGMKERNKELNNIIGKVNTNNSTVKSFANKITENRST
mgnify:FL=1